jgi:hypothetical protein
MCVSQLRVDAGLTLVLDDAAEITVACSATLVAEAAPGLGPVPFRLAPHRQQVGPALALVGARVVAGAAFKDGRLRLLFDGGSQLQVMPDGRDEAWRAVGPGSLQLVCLAGGGVAVWR